MSTLLQSQKVEPDNAIAMNKLSSNAIVKNKLSKMTSAQSTQQMYLDTQLKAVCTNFFEDLTQTDKDQNEIYYTILYFIHAAQHLSKLYLNWTALQAYEKCVLNAQMKASLPKTGKLIYPPLIRAFHYWDTVQNTFGAPGFNHSPLKAELSEETDRSIVKMMLVMERTINQLQLKQKVMAEMKSYKDPRNILYSYKWHIICKNMNKKRSCLTQNKNETPMVTGGSTEENYGTDLNGSGDTSWFSDVE